MSDRPRVETDRLQLAWIGTGVMGSAMCGHLLDAGHAVAVHTRTRARAEPLLEQGATWSATPADAAAEADVVFTMVGFPSDVRAVVLGADGALARAREGSILVDMTTSEPSLAREIHGAATAKGVASIDAPVSGGDVGARAGTLSIFVGGDGEAVNRVLPLLELMGRTIVHQGGPGTGQHAKMVNQILIASTMVGICEALLYSQKAGLDLESVLTPVAGGAAGSWLLSNLAPRAIRGDFTPGFIVEHFLKDMEIALAEARESSLSLPGLALAHELYVAVSAQGRGRMGTQALLPALGRLSDADWDPVEDFPDLGA